MQGYNFTEGLRHTLALAREESARLHHEYVGTEHILLGLLRRAEGVAFAVLEDLVEVDVQRLKADIERVITPGNAATVAGPDLPYTSRAKRVLELAMKAARELGHGYVGSEHLLLGLLDEKKGVAAQVLTQAGVTHPDALTRLLEMLGGTGPAPAPSRSGSLIPTPTAPSLVVVELRYEGGWSRRREFRTAAQAMAFLSQL